MVSLSRLGISSFIVPPGSRNLWYAPRSSIIAWDVVTRWSGLGASGFILSLFESQDEEVLYSGTLFALLYKVLRCQGSAM